MPGFPSAGVQAPQLSPRGEHGDSAEAPEGGSAKSPEGGLPYNGRSLICLGLRG